MAAAWLEELNEAQRRAATFGDGPLLVIAGAGTGKTKTLAARVAHLIEQGVSPQRILLLTFTRRAAAEMLHRAGVLVGPGASGQVWGGTFHATSNRLLRQYGRSIGLSPDFTVMDQSDAADMMNLIRGELRLGQGKKRFPRKSTLVAAYSRAVNSRTKLGEILARYFPWCEEEHEGIRQIYEIYTRRKREQHVLDYDDLLLFWKALCEAPGVGEEVAGRFDHVLVDEYQDTNLVQAEILLAMRREKKSITVVGDDAQSIYSFRAATVRNILDFPSQFGGAETIALEQNYRSVQPILNASNAVMGHAKERYTKELFSARVSERRPQIVTCMDEAEQCEAVCERVLGKLEEGVALRKQAVLFRAGHHSDALEVELTRRNIPFVKFGGLKFIEAAHIKDMLALLRILENPGDELSWFRVLQLLEGIGPATARRMIADLGIGAEMGGEGGTAEGEEVASEGEKGGQEGNDGTPLRVLKDRPPIAPPAAKQEFAALREALLDCQGYGGGRAKISPASQVERLRRFYEPVFERVYDNPHVRLRDLEQLETIASGYRSRRQFLTDLTLDPPTSTQDLAGPPLLDEDYLILSTIHSAKGCEWDAVYVIHVADGMIPSDMATGSDEEIEEERRLLYVAMTRSRDTLSLLFPLRYYHRGKRRSDRHSYAQITRFIPEQDKRLYEVVSGQRVREMEEDKVHGGGERGDVRASIDAMLGELWD